MKKSTRSVAIGYIRVSTAGQAVEGVSLAAQRARLEAWATGAGVELLAVHEDAGLSGSKASNRPALQAALAQVCKLGGILAVYSLSRMARSIKDTITITEKLEKSGADLVSLTEAIDTRSASGKMVYRMLSVLNEFERDLVSERTKGAMSHLRAQGRRISGKIPFGSDLVGDHLVPNPGEVATIALMAELRAGGRSLRQVADELDSRGLTAKAGGLWAPKVISFVLRRDAEKRAA